MNTQDWQYQDWYYEPAKQDDVMEWINKLGREGLFYVMKAEPFDEWGCTKEVLAEHADGNPWPSAKVTVTVLGGDEYGLSVTIANCENRAAYVGSNMWLEQLQEAYEDYQKHAEKQ